MGYIRLLKDVMATDSDEFGSKCVALANLERAGYRVPPSIAVSNGAYKKRTETSLARFELKRWDLLTLQERRSLAQQIQQAIRSETSLGEFRNELEVMLTTTFGTDPNLRLAVRSSAIAEDSSDHSFAGQMDTYLNVPISDIEGYIIKCWSSLWSTTAIDYQFKMSVPLTAWSMAVLIQPLLIPESSGVMFTSNPVHSSHDTVVIEAVRGLGIVLVAGTAPPDQYLIQVGDGEPTSAKIVQISSSDRELLPGPEAEELVQSAVPRDVIGLPVLSEARILELAKLGLEIESLFGTPQDIEWVWAEGGFWFLQARPITTTSAKSVMAHTSSAPLPSEAIIRIGNECSELISEELQRIDKVRLRLISDRNKLLMSPGWLLTVRAGAFESSLPPDMLACVQVSMVLLQPKLLNGKVHRQFSVGEKLVHNMGIFVESILSVYRDFTFIVTEIYTPTMSGIAKIIDSRVVIEVAFGSYIAKGIAATSLYVTDEHTQIFTEKLCYQVEAVYIVEGKPKLVRVDAEPRLSSAQLQELYKTAITFRTYYPTGTLEFGIDHQGRVYIIDVIEEHESTSITLDNMNIVSSGQIVGNAIRVSDEETLWDSLDAHYHSQRRTTDGVSPEATNTIVVARLPFLALEELIAGVSPDEIGFVFEQGSILGHFGIILRELGIPAVISADMYSKIETGDTVRINTSLLPAQMVTIVERGAHIL